MGFLFEICKSQCTVLFLVVTHFYQNLWRCGSTKQMVKRNLYNHGYEYHVDQKAWNCNLVNPTNFSIFRKGNPYHPSTYRPDQGGPVAWVGGPVACSEYPRRVSWKEFRQDPSSNTSNTFFNVCYDLKRFATICAWFSMTFNSCFNMCCQFLRFLNRIRIKQMNKCRRRSPPADKKIQSFCWGVVTNMGMLVAWHGLYICIFCLNSIKL